jgi:hypothetical protein
VEPLRRPETRETANPKKSKLTPSREIHKQSM